MQKRISIPTPCSENWNAMTPREQGRFCDKCTKVVTDFSAMSNEEILAFLSKKQDEVCGRLRQDQLTTSPTLTDKLKKFLYAFALVFLPFISWGQSDKDSSSTRNSGMRTLSSKAAVITTKGSMNGPVLNLQGELISNALVALKQDGKTIAKTFTDSTGYYNITPLAKGAYEIECIAPGYKTTILTKAHLKQSKSWHLPITLGKLNDKDPRTFLVHDAPEYSDPDVIMMGGLCIESHVESGTRIQTIDWLNRAHKLMNLNTDR